MKKILLLTLPTFLLSCETETSKNMHYNNIDLRVVSINSEDSFTSGKHRTPRLCNMVLFETIKEPHLFMVINTCKEYGNLKLDDKWLYNHEAGDTVHFDYLNKERFFTIDKRK